MGKCLNIRFFIESFKGITLKVSIYSSRQGYMKICEGQDQSLTFGPGLLPYFNKQTKNSPRAT